MMKKNSNEEIYITIEELRKEKYTDVSKDLVKQILEKESNFIELSGDSEILRVIEELIESYLSKTEE